MVFVNNSSLLAAYPALETKNPPFRAGFENGWAEAQRRPPNFLLNLSTRPAASTKRFSPV